MSVFRTRKTSDAAAEDAPTGDAVDRNVRREADVIVPGPTPQGESTTQGAPPQQADVGSQPIDSIRSTRRRSSINTRILLRMLPVVLLPLLLIGLVSIGAIALIQTRTDAAVSAAEDVLTEEIVQVGVNRASSRAAREIGDFIDLMITDTGELSERRDVGLAIAEGNNRLAELKPDGAFLEADELRQALVGEQALVSKTFVESLAGALAADGHDANQQVAPEVSLFSSTGVQLGNSSGTPALPAGGQLWFRQALASNAAEEVTSFVVDDTGRASFEIVRRATLINDQNIVGVIRVRVPLETLHAIVDRVAAESDESIDFAVFDRELDHLLADTSNDHDPNLLYNTDAMLDNETFDVEMVDEGIVEDEDFLVSSSTVLADDETGSKVVSWIVQVRQPTEIASAPLDNIREVSDDVASTRSLISLGLMSLLVVALFIAFRAARRIATRITGPITALSIQAQSAASEGIPLIVEAAEQSEEDLPGLEPFIVDTEDELAVLADSLNVMQSAAVGLATGQAKLRRQNVSRTFVSLGRRNQNLLNRQLEFIDDLERSETDPDTLQDLFRLDHLATRMRRNAENLLVLAGEQTPRRWAKPIALRDVIQAAASEIADYSRVQIGDIDDATVSGSLATDISHLVAELLENAATFSPPTASIEVVGQNTPTHYRLAIMDQGIGMDDGAIAQANHRLANPVDFADAPSAYIGLFVVGHLARQLGVRVRLTKGESVNLGDVVSGAGTIAFIDLPNSLLSDDMAHPIDLPARAQKAAAGLIDPAVEDTEPASYFDDGDQTTESTTAADFVQAEDDGPPVTFWDEPVRAEEEVVPEPAEIPTAPVTEAGFPKRRRGAVGAAADASTPEPVVGPDSAGQTPVGQTAAGFPKRTSVSADATPEAAPPAPEAQPTPTRDPAALSNSLLSFKDAVKRGREEAFAEATPAAPGPPISVPPTKVAQPPQPAAPAQQPVAPARQPVAPARQPVAPAPQPMAPAQGAQPTAPAPAAKPVAPPLPTTPEQPAQSAPPAPAQQPVPPAPAHASAPGPNVDPAVPAQRQTVVAPAQPISPQFTEPTEPRLADDEPAENTPTQPPRPQTTGSMP